MDNRANGLRPPALKPGHTTGRYRHRGPVTLWVKAKDKLGNWGTETAVTITLDRTAPGELSLVHQEMQT